MKGSRFLVLGGIWFAAFFLALDRVNISLATPLIIEELHLSGVQMGFILGMFFWGFLAANPLGGIAADNLSMRKFASLMLLGWSALTALTGTCHTLLQLAIIRGLFGVSEGASVPSLNKLQNHWLLPEERGRYWGVFAGFFQLGVAFGLPLVGWMIRLWDWRVMFCASGTLTLLAVAVFYTIIRDHAHEHPWIRPDEKERLASALERDRVTYDAATGKAVKLSFKQAFAQLARNWAFWMLFVCGVLEFSLYYASLSWLPTYLVKGRGLTITQSGLYLTLPYLAGFVGSVGAGYLGDKVGNRTLVAALFCLLTLPAILGAMTFQSNFWAILCLALAILLASGPMNSFIVLLMDGFPPEIFGTAFALVIGLGAGLCGAVSPIIVGHLLDMTGSFFWGFTTFSLAGIVGAFLSVPLIFYERQVKAAKAASRLEARAFLGVEGE